MEFDPAVPDTVKYEFEKLTGNLNEQGKQRNYGHAELLSRADTSMNYTVLSQRGNFAFLLAVALFLAGCATTGGPAGFGPEAGAQEIAALFSGIQPGLVEGPPLPPSPTTDLALIFATDLSPVPGTRSPTPAAGGATAAPGLPSDRPAEALAGLLRLARAYPGRISSIVPVGGQVYVRSNGEWYRWAGGRTVPAATNPAEDGTYVVLWDFGDPEEPVWKRTVSESDAELAILRASLDATDNRRQSPFLARFFGIESRDQAEALMVPVSFLGQQIFVHPVLVAPIQRVQARIAAGLPGDRAATAFVAGLNEIWGFYWREIAGTSRMSYHSLGLAIDFLPKSYDSKVAYWRWTASYLPDAWWKLRESQVWIPPRLIMDAFEAEGFVWGGRWLAYDTIHFEYHPENFW